MKTFRQICDLFGGQTATSVVLGLKNSRDVRRAVKENAIRPNWLPILKASAIEKGKELIKWGNENESENENEIIVAGMKYIAVEFDGNTPDCDVCDFQKFEHKCILCCSDERKDKKDIHWVEKKSK